MDCPVLLNDFGSLLLNDETELLLNICQEVSLRASVGANRQKIIVLPRKTIERDIWFYAVGKIERVEIKSIRAKLLLLLKEGIRGRIASEIISISKALLLKHNLTELYSRISIPIDQNAYSPVFDPDRKPRRTK